jgi:hypothetical protein
MNKSLNKSTNYLLKMKSIVKYFNILFFIWVLVRAYVFDRHLSYMDYGDFFPLFFYSIYLLILLLFDYIFNKLFNKFKDKTKTIVINSIILLIMILY